MPKCAHTWTYVHDGVPDGHLERVNECAQSSKAVHLYGSNDAKEKISTGKVWWVTQGWQSCIGNRRRESNANACFHKCVPLSWAMAFWCHFIIYTNFNFHDFLVKLSKITNERRNGSPNNYCFLFVSISVSNTRQYARTQAYAHKRACTDADKLRTLTPSACVRAYAVILYVVLWRTKTN